MPPDETPDWARADDPWLTTRMDAYRRIRDAEEDVYPAVTDAMGRFLEQARGDVLGGGSGQAAALIAAVGDDRPPDLGQWPDDAVWTRLVNEVVLPALTGHWGEAFRAAARETGLAAQRWREEYMQQVRDRLSPDKWPAGVFEQVRAEITEAVAEGFSTEQVAARLADLLDINAWSREIRARAAELRRLRDAPDTSERGRERARAELRELYRGLGPADRQWQPDARRIARTEVIGALNGGTLSGAQAWQDESGESQVKTWIATDDARVRETHDAADQQQQPLNEPFTVGGFPLMFPGDPSGPPQEVIQCRCAVAVVPAADAETVTAATKGETVTTPQETQPDTDQQRDLPDGWRGVLAPLNSMSGDRRIIGLPTSGEARTRPLPLPLAYQDVRDDGHDNSFVAGSIDAAWIQDGHLMGQGRFDLDDERGADAARRLADGFMRWVSVDLDDTTSSIKVRYQDGTLSDPENLADLDDLPADAQLVMVADDWRLMAGTMVATPAFPEAELQPVYGIADEPDPTAETGDEDPLVATVVGSTDLPFAPREREWNSSAAKTRIARWASSDGSGEKDEINWRRYARAFLYRAPQDDSESDDGPDFGDFKLPFADVVDGELRAVYRGVASAAAALRGARGGVQGIPSDERDRIRRKLSRLYEKARKAFDDPNIRAPWDRREASALLAAGGPSAPPAGWFTDPGLSGPTALTVTDGGRVYGHLASWGTCHTGQPGACVTPPASASGYTYFHVGALETAEGETVPVGTVVTDTDHAGLDAGHSSAAAHYADTGCAVAAVRAGEDRHGIWVAGALLPGVTDGQVATLRRSPLSGDWRVIGGRQELVAALAVNVPGFPLPRERTAAGSAPYALVAAGAVPKPDSSDGEGGFPNPRGFARMVAEEMVRLNTGDGDADTDTDTPDADPGGGHDDAGGDVGGRAAAARARVARVRANAAV